MKPRTAGLMKKAKESLEAAEILMQQGYVDFAASRAYYAMFYVAEALLFEKHELKFSSHSGVIGAFGKEFAKPGVLDQKLHRYLLDAQAYRAKGDYGVDEVVSEPIARDTLKWAAEFIVAGTKILEAKPNN